MANMVGALVSVANSVAFHVQSSTLPAKRICPVRRSDQIPGSLPNPRKKSLAWAFVFLTLCSRRLRLAHSANHAYTTTLNRTSVESLRGELTPQHIAR